MTFITHLFLGYIMAFVSLLLPGMLNMTAARTAIEKTIKEAMTFAMGAALVVIPQAMIALVFAKFFAKNPEIIENLKVAGIVVLLTLSVVFFFQARKKLKPATKPKKGKSLIMGMMMSTMNMLAIPFYLVLSSVLEKKGWLIMSQPFISIFVAGVFLGALSLFMVYIRFAMFIQRKAGFIARNISYILSGLFFVLGILALIKYIK